MIDLLDLFGRGEIKRLNYELRDRENKLKAAQHETSFLSGIRTAQGAAIEALQERLRAEEELNRHLPHENKKLWDMYRASEAARQKAVGERRGSDAPSSVACGDNFSPKGGEASFRISPASGVSAATLSTGGGL